MTEKFGPLPDFPEPDKRTPGEILDDMLNGLLGPPPSQSATPEPPLASFSPNVPPGGFPGTQRVPTQEEFMGGEVIPTLSSGDYRGKGPIPAIANYFTSGGSYNPLHGIEKLPGSLLNFLRMTPPDPGNPLGAFGGGYNPFTEDQSQVPPWNR